MEVLNISTLFYFSSGVGGSSLILNRFWGFVIKLIHGEDACLGSIGCTTNGIWAKIISSINSLHPLAIISKGMLRFVVGCHNQLRFWKDIWLGDDTLC